MVLLNYSKIISSISDGLVSYISKLEDLKYQYISQLEDFNKLNSLYENMNYDLEKFVFEFAKSSKEKKDYFKVIANDIYDDKRLFNRLLNETRNDYLVSLYSGNNSYPMLNDFKNKIKEKLDSLNLMLNEDKIKEIELKIYDYLDFSDILDKDRFNNIFDPNKFVDIIDSLDIDSDTKILAMEMGIKEFNRIYSEKLEIEYSSYNELTLDDINNVGEYSIDFDFDEVENE